MELTPRQGDAVGFGISGVVALFSLLQLAASGSISWLSIAGLAAVTAVIVGPLAWVLRERVPDERRARLTLVGGVLLLILGQIGLGLAMVYDVPFVSSFHGAIVGLYLGLLAVLLVEQTVVPERLRYLVSSAD